MTFTFETTERNGKTLLLASDPELTALLTRILLKLRELRRRESK